MPPGPQDPQHYKQLPSVFLSAPADIAKQALHRYQGEQFGVGPLVPEAGRDHDGTWTQWSTTSRPRSHRTRCKRAQTSAHAGFPHSSWVEATIEFDVQTR